MKYMGSKRVMLKNGLGHLIEEQVVNADRFVDLFTGSAAVAAFVATRFNVPVLAVDLQEYGAVLARAVVGRCRVPDNSSEWRNWLRRAQYRQSKLDVVKLEKVTQETIRAARGWCRRQSGLPITRAYGGHYFSPEQASWLDALRIALPETEPARTIALAALINATSQCAAAPGHTAQPFQPTRTARRFLKEGWNRDVVTTTKHAFESLVPMRAKRKGEGRVADANEIADKLTDGDLVFLDPPYSGVHYSRFYHVLETVAHGECGDVFGVGRYPTADRRPRSRYSLKSESADALDELLGKISAQRARVILTFPDQDCSNGLSGKAVRAIAQRHFIVSERTVRSTFSTLGGTNGNAEKPHRPARHHADELILLLAP